MRIPEWEPTIPRLRVGFKVCVKYLFNKIDRSREEGTEMKRLKS